MRNKLFIFLLFCLCPIIIFSGCNKKSVLGIEKLSTYKISAVLDIENNYTLTCSQSVNVYNDTDTDLKELKFHLYPKAFSVGAINPAVGPLYTTKAYPNGVSYGDITIESCLNEKNTSSFYFEGADKDILVLPLNETLENKKFTNIEISYTVKLPNINHRFGYGEKVINLGNFYPILCVYENGEFSTNPYSTNGDPFYSNISNYEVDFTYPSNYILAHTGDLITSKDEGLLRSCNIKANNVRDFALSLSANFNQKTEKVADTTISYFYYNDKNPDSSLKACVDSLNTFNNLFGKYPYNNLFVVETNFVYGGMEYPNLVYISDDINSYNDYINTIVHEIAHQWWYGMVGNDEFSCGWLDEGLTEYSTALFYECNPSYEIDFKDVIKNTTNSYLLFVQVYTDVFGNCNTTMNRKLNEYNTEPEYVYIAYVKAVLLMNDIRELVGKEAFIKGLKLYFETYKGKNATPENFIDCMEKSTRKPLKDVFNSYINGKVIILSNE